MEQSHINNLIKKVLNIEWEPDIDQDALRIIDKCGSDTERLFLIGAAHFIECSRDKYGGELSGTKLPIIGCKISHNNITYEGIWFVCPWGGWSGGIGGGPTACAFVPQLKFPDTSYHHDFGLFYGESDGGGGPWHFKCAIEIDPEYTHKDRRDKDAYRDSIVDYDVIRIYDEVHNALSWFEEIINRDENIITEYLDGEESDNR
jgi:hypothetical protein